MYTPYSNTSYQHIGTACCLLRAFLIGAHSVRAPLSKSPLSKSLTHRGLLAVFHELCKVEQCLCDFRDVGDRESQLEIGHQVLLLSRHQLHPTGDKGGIEQLTAGGAGGGNSTRQAYIPSSTTKYVHIFTDGAEHQSPSHSTPHQSHSYSTSHQSHSHSTPHLSLSLTPLTEQVGCMLEQEPSRSAGQGLATPSAAPPPADAATPPSHPWRHVLSPTTPSGRHSEQHTYSSSSTLLQHLLVPTLLCCGTHKVTYSLQAGHSYTDLVAK